MDNFDTARGRLHDLIADGGLVADEARLTSMQAALNPVLGWLSEGPSRSILQANQLLMLDPKAPDCQRLPEVKAIANVVRDTWVGAGQASALNGLQLLVLSVWPELSGSNVGLPQLTRIAWQTLDMNAENLKGRERWLAGLADFSGSTPINFAGHVSIGSPSEAGGNTGAALIAKQKRFTDSWRNDWAYMKATADNLVEALELSEGRWKALRNHLSPPRRVRLSSSGVEQFARVLWWGQAAYSTTAQKSYRRLSESDRLAFAAMEASDFIDNAAFNPLAAYVGEVLNSLGDPWDDTRSVNDWLAMLADSAEHLVDLEKPQSFTGLPVLALAHGVPLDEIAKQTRLDLTTEIDRADWITWVLGEVILGKALAE